MKIGLAAVTIQGFLLGLCGIGFPDWRFFVLMAPLIILTAVLAWKVEP